jgi:hypothetical protein
VGGEFHSIKQGAYVMNIFRFSDVNYFFVLQKLQCFEVLVFAQFAQFNIINVDIGSFIVEQFHKFEHSLPRHTVCFRQRVFMPTLVLF